MAVTGVLKADFGEFLGEVKKAEVALKGMEGGAAKVETSLNEMTGGSIAPMNTLRDSFNQVDQALAASGVNIGKYTRGLAEIADMAGKTAKEIGWLASGSAIFAAAMAGIQFGTWIRGFANLDEQIRKDTVSLGLFADVAAETAGAQQDTINRALSKGAEEGIKYAEAVKFLTQQAQAQNDAYAVGAERLAAAQKEVRGLSDATIAQIEIAKKNGATTEQITRHFDISADALRALAERQKDAGKAAEAHTKALEQQRKEAAELDKTYEKLMSDISNANQLAIMEADHARMVAAEMKKKNDAAAGWISAQVKATAAMRETIAAEEAYLKEQDALTAATDALSVAHAEGGQAATQATSQAMQGYAGLAQQVTLTADAIRAMLDAYKYANEVNAILSTNSLFTTQSQYSQIAALSSGNRSGAFGGGGGTTVNNHVTVTGSVIAEHELGNVVGKAIVSQMMSTGQKLSGY